MESSQITLDAGGENVSKFGGLVNTTWSQHTGTVSQLLLYQAQVNVDSIWYLRNKTWAGKMAEQGKALSAKPNDLSLVHGTHCGRRELIL